MSRTGFGNGVTAGTGFVPTTQLAYVGREYWNGEDDEIVEPEVPFGFHIVPGDEMRQLQNCDWLDEEMRHGYTDEGENEIGDSGKCVDDDCDETMPETRDYYDRLACARDCGRENCDEYVCMCCSDPYEFFADANHEAAPELRLGYWMPAALAPNYEADEGVSVAERVVSRKRLGSARKSSRHGHLKSEWNEETGRVIRLYHTTGRGTHSSNDTRRYRRGDITMRVLGGNHSRPGAGPTWVRSDIAPVAADFPVSPRADRRLRIHAR